MLHGATLVSVSCATFSLAVHGFAAFVPSVRNPRFTFGLSSNPRPQRNSRTYLSALVSPESKFFNLEELEDSETCITEVFLDRDHTVHVGETDGPIPSRAGGIWELIDDGTFRMSITRTFDAGKESKTITDMGEFTFDVKRIFTGEMSMVGECISVSGRIHEMDEWVGDREVGFFSLIDTTDARLGNEEEWNQPSPGVLRTS